MLLGAIILGMVFYTAGVLTGVWLGFSIKKEITALDQQNTAPSKRDTIKILKYARKNGKITNDQLQELLSVSDSTAQRYLQKLSSSDQLSRHGKTKSIYYKAK